MGQIVKRKLRQTWRDAVAARLAEADPAGLEGGLAAFDAERAGGQGEAEAAYAVLAARRLLWTVDAPGFATAGADPDGPHAVPSA